MYYILFYKTIDNYIERRGQFREHHLKYANEYHERGELLLGGALSEPVDGALLVFKCESPETVERFVKNDPYVINGLITQWRIRPWTVVIGGNNY
jgi:uncharacterized protein YciI